MKYLFLIAFLCFVNTTHGQQCDTTFLAPDSVQLLTDYSVDAFQKNGDTMFIAGNFHSVGRPTGSFIGVNKSTGKPVHQASWPKVAGKVNFATSDGNGGWIIGGKFNRVGDSLRKNIAWIDNTEHVTSWNPNVNDEVTSGVRVDSILYVGGNFTQVSNITRTKLAAVKLNSNATLQSLNVSIDDQVNAMAIFGNNLWIGGYFNTIAGQTRRKLTAINLSTSLPIAQITNLDSGFLDNVVTILVADGNLFVGGAFQNIQTQPGGTYTTRSHMLSLDAGTGILRSWLCNTADGISATGGGGVYALDTIGNNIVLGGAFDFINNIQRSGIGMVDRFSGQVQPFNGSVINNGIAPVRALTHDADNIYAGNVQYAKSAGGGPNDVVKTYGLASFNTVTGIVAGFRPVIAPVKNLQMLINNIISGAYEVRALINDNNTVFIGGECKFIGGDIRHRIASFIMSPGELTAFTSNLFTDDDDYFTRTDSMRFINNMVMASGRMFLSGRKITNGTTGTVLAAFDIQTGNKLTFPSPNWVNNPGACFKLVTYGNWVYADMDYSYQKIFRFNPLTLQFDNTWELEYPFNFSSLSKRMFDIYNDILYLKVADNNYYYIKPYQLSTATELLVGAMLVPQLWINYPDMSDMDFIGDKAVISGRFDRLQSPIPGQNLRYGIGFIQMNSNNTYAPSPHVLDEFTGNINVSPAYNGIEKFGDRIYSTRRHFEEPGNPFKSTPRIYDTAGIRWYSNWNPQLQAFTPALVPFNKDTVAIFANFTSEQILEDRPYYGMVRFHLGTTVPDANVQIAVQPGQQVLTGAQVTFTSSATNAGNAASYNWYRNNQLISGANSATWQATAVTDFDDNDEIKARLIATYPCSDADTAWSNGIVMHVNPLSISGVNQPRGFNAYPNPTSGIVHFTGIEHDDYLNIYDLLGRKTATYDLKNGNSFVVDISRYNKGLYVFKFNRKNGKTWSVAVTKL